jgi:hypothetical protein
MLSRSGLKYLLLLRLQQNLLRHLNHSLHHRNRRLHRMRLNSYASDVLEDAQVLAQVKSFNSFSFRDQLNLLTELWGYCYEKICLIDDGYYSTTVQLTQELTHLPPYVKNTVKVYHAQEIVGYNREVYKEAGMKDLVSGGTFYISGNDLYCRDAVFRQVFLSYVPQPKFVTFTKNNRDPKILNEAPPIVEATTSYGEYTLDKTDDKYVFISKRDEDYTVDMTDAFTRPDKKVKTFILDYPYIFVTYYDTVIKNYESFIYKNVLGYMEVIRYNPFDYQGRPSNVQFLKARFNDYTGMGVVIQDHDDNLIKELGWTPDTLLTYPSRIMYNYLVANIAKRFASLNGSMIPGVEEALAASRYEMGAFLKKDKSGWGRIDNVTRPTLGDLI